MTGSKCPDPAIHLLGEIVIAFGNLESDLDFSICNLLASEEERFVMAQALTADMNFSKKVDVFVRMFRQKEVAGVEEELMTLRKNLESAGGARNKLIHSAWSEPCDGQDTWMLSKFCKGNEVKGKGPRYKFEPMPAKRIEEIRDQIMEAGALLALFEMKYIQAR